MKHDRKSLIRAVKKFGRTQPGRLKLMEFCRAAGTEHKAIHRAFGGGFSALLKAARMHHRAARPARLDAGILLEDLARVATKLGRPPTYEELMVQSRYCIACYYKYIGTWPEVLAAYDLWKSGTPLQDLPLIRSLSRVCPPPRRKPASANVPPSTPTPAMPPASHAVGAPINFRGLVYAPITESGVVHLFGVLAPEVDLVVETIGVAFPDCYALRAHPDGKWRRLAVEFELKSSNFRAHGHDPKKCDVIVCWENDWKGCPLEVIELKDVMRQVMAKRAKNDAGNAGEGTVAREV